MALFSGGGAEEARGSRDALVRAAIKTYNKRSERLEGEREEARKQVNIMRRETQREKAAAKKKSDESAMWKGIFSGAGTGAQVGGAISPGWGHLIGGVAGAVGGGIWGAEDPESFYETAPMVAQAGQIAAQIGGEFRQKEYMDERMKMMDKWMSQGSGSAGVGAVSPTATGGAGTLGLPGESKYTTPESTFGPATLDFAGEEVAYDKIRQSSDPFSGVDPTTGMTESQLNAKNLVGSRKSQLMDLAMKRHGQHSAGGDARSAGMLALEESAGGVTAGQQQQAEELRRAKARMMAGATTGGALGSSMTSPRAQNRGLNYLTLGGDYTGLLPDYMRPLPTPFTR